MTTQKVLFFACSLYSSKFTGQAKKRRWTSQPDSLSFLNELTGTWEHVEIPVKK
jgi:hypothetical protein